MSNKTLAIALSSLIAVSVGKAATTPVAAFFIPTNVQRSAGVGPIRTSFRDVRGRGLLLRTWFNGKGPYTCVVDTGAGDSIISERIVSDIGVSVSASRRTLLGGLSTSPISSNKQTTISAIGVGGPTNVINKPVIMAVASGLPDGIDGILDPIDFSRFGYAIDLSLHQLEIFSEQIHLAADEKPEGGAVVRWIRQPGDTRPFVRLGDGRVALIDTGSNFGLAVSDNRGSNHGRITNSVHDLGGGSVQANRVAPTTVSIGDLELRNVPTDVLSGVAPGTPLILGRDALGPFKITFDPISRLIEIVPSRK